MIERVRTVPGLVNVDTDLRLDHPQLNVVFDRERAADLGVPIRRIAEALQILLAQSETNEFVLRNKHVYMQDPLLLGLGVSVRFTALIVALTAA